MFTLQRVDAASSTPRHGGSTRSTSGCRGCGVGKTRAMPAVFGALIVDEVYFRWEDGRRQSFYVERANLPMFRLTWTIAGALALQ